MVFATLTLILAWGLLEFAGFVLIRITLGDWFSLSELQLRRDRRVAQFDSRSAFEYAQIHPYAGFVEQPGSATGVHALSDGRLVPITEYGYVDDKLPFQTRGSDRLIIGITGGSVACYFGVNGTKRLESALARDSRFAGKQLIFVNIALGGYKQPQQLMTLAYLLSLGAEFDLILNIDGFNEIVSGSIENGSDQVFPAFPMNWRVRVAGNDTNLGLARGKLLLLGAERAAQAQRFSRSPWRYSILCNLVWEILDRRLARRIEQVLGDYQELVRDRSSYVVTGPRREFATMEEHYAFLAEIWANSSVLMNQLCRSRGIGYYHFLQPNQYLAGSKPMGDVEKRIAILENHPYREAVRIGYPLVKGKRLALQNAGVSYHDLTSIFAEHSESLYIDNCCHYNQAGYEIMADAIAGAILSDTATEKD